MELMKAVLTEKRFSDPGWIYERKLDGIRCVAEKAGGTVSLRSRNDLDLSGRFPAIKAALEANAATDAVFDGEVVAPDGRFGSLQQGGAVLYYVFDVLRFDGEDVTGRPLLELKKLLRDSVTFEDPLRLSVYRREHGEAFYAEACEQGWEGLIAKRADSTYVRGRSRDWLKFKCTAEQELVIGGFTEPKGSRTDLGALLVGHFADGELRYAGKVGTGFTRDTLRDLAARLAPLRRDDSPFADAPRLRSATWVQPELVAQIGFAEWTRDGRLRHPRFLGLRDDKAAREVVRES